MRIVFVTLHVGATFRPVEVADPATSSTTRSPETAAAAAPQAAIVAVGTTGVRTLEASAAGEVNGGGGRDQSLSCPR